MGCTFIQPESELSLPKPPPHKSLAKAMDSDIAEGKNNASLKNQPADCNWVVKCCWLRNVGMAFQRRIAESRIFFETFQAELRACPLTLRVRSPKQWERYAASRCAEGAEAFGVT